MAKMSQSRINELAQKCLQGGNPYINGAIKYFIDRRPMFIWHGDVYTQEELDQAYLETASKDIQKGFEERMVGYYDKWYRYNHADEGRAYDEGVKAATAEPQCKEEMTIIPCMA